MRNWWPSPRVRTPGRRSRRCSPSSPAIRNPRRCISANRTPKCSPGCYPTSILLPVIPLLKAGIIKPAGIIADSMSGVSGAGRKAEIDYLFCECNESVRPYGVPKHRHLSEIEEQLSFAAGTKVTIQFTPHLIPVNRGILTTLYLAPEKHFSSSAGAAKLAEKISACYQSAYANEQ